MRYVNSAQYLVIRKRTVIYPYLHRLLTSVYEKYRIYVKSPFFIGLRSFTDRIAEPGCSTKQHAISLELQQFMEEYMNVQQLFISARIFSFHASRKSLKYHENEFNEFILQILIQTHKKMKAECNKKNKNILLFTQEHKRYIHIFFNKLLQLETDCMLIS